MKTEDKLREWANTFKLVHKKNKQDKLVLTIGKTLKRYVLFSILFGLGVYQLLTGRREVNNLIYPIIP